MYTNEYVVYVTPQCSDHTRSSLKHDIVNKISNKVQNQMEVIKACSACALLGLDSILSSINILFSSGFTLLHSKQIRFSSVIHFKKNQLNMVLNKSGRTSQDNKTLLMIHT